jgi:hypothetical protein
MNCGDETCACNGGTDYTCWHEYLQWLEERYEIAIRNENYRRQQARNIEGRGVTPEPECIARETWRE